MESQAQFPTVSLCARFVVSKAATFSVINLWACSRRTIIRSREEISPLLLRRATSGSSQLLQPLGMLVPHATALQFPALVWRLSCFQLLFATLAEYTHLRTRASFHVELQNKNEIKNEEFTRKQTCVAARLTIFSSCSPIWWWVLDS